MTTTAARHFLNGGWTLDERPRCPKCDSATGPAGTDHDCAWCIKAGDRVSLLVNDLGGYVSGVVARVYTDAAGTEVADVELYGTRIFVQNTAFLTVTGATS